MLELGTSRIGNKIIPNEGCANSSTSNATIARKLVGTQAMEPVGTRKPAGAQVMKEPVGARKPVGTQDSIDDIDRPRSLAEGCERF